METEFDSCHPLDLVRPFEHQGWFPWDSFPLVVWVRVVPWHPFVPFRSSYALDVPLGYPFPLDSFLALVDLEVLQVPWVHEVPIRDGVIHVLVRVPFHEVAFHALVLRGVHHAVLRVEDRDVPLDRPCGEDAFPWVPFPTDRHVPCLLLPYGPSFRVPRDAYG